MGCGHLVNLKWELIIKSTSGAIWESGQPRRHVSGWDLAVCEMCRLASWDWWNSGCWVLWNETMSIMSVPCIVPSALVLETWRIWGSGDADVSTIASGWPGSACSDLWTNTWVRAVWKGAITHGIYGNPWENHFCNVDGVSDSPRWTPEVATLDRRVAPCQPPLYTFYI